MVKIVELGRDPTEIFSSRKFPESFTSKGFEFICVSTTITPKIFITKKNNINF